MPADSTSSSGDAGSVGTLPVLFNVEPEQPQLKTESAVSAVAKPELPKIPAPELPKSSMPESPMCGAGQFSWDTPVRTCHKTKTIMYPSQIGL